MKLFVVALCVCAAMAEVHWDPSGQHRVIETEPIISLAEPEYKIKITGPADARYRIVGAPLPAEYPLAYQYLDPTLLYRPAYGMASVAVRSLQPFVYSYTQMRADEK